MTRRSAWLTLALAAALTLASVALILTRLELDTDFRAMLAPDAPSLAAIDAAEARFGAISPLLLLVDGPDAETLIAESSRVQAALEATDAIAVAHVHSDLGPLQALSAPFADAPLRPWLLTDDGQTLVYILRLREELTDIAQHRAVQDAVQGALSRAGPRPSGEPIPHALIGGLERSQAEFALLAEDMQRTSVISFLLILALLTLALRRLRALLYLGAPLLLGVLATLAFAAAIGRPLNLISGFVAALLTGLGVDVAIHLLARFDDARRDGLDVPDAIHATLRSTGAAALLASLTTGVAFLTMLTSGFPGFSELGLLAGVGMLLVTLTQLLVLPALLTLLEGRWPAAPPPPIPTPPRPRRRAAAALLIAAIALAGLGLASLPSLRFDEDFATFSVELSEEAARPYARAADALGAPPSSTLVALTETPDDARRLSAALRRHLAGDAAEHLTGISSVHGLPVVPTWLRRLHREIGPEGSGDARRVVLIQPGPDMSDGATIRATRHELEGVVAEAGLEAPARIASPAFILTDLYDALREESRRLFGLALLCVALVTLIALRRARDAALATLPLLLGAAWIVAVMRLAGIELDMFNLAALLIIIGLGVDDGVHLIHRLRETDDVRRTWATAGPPVLLTSATTGVAFGSLIFTRHAGLQSLGTLALIGIAATALVALLVLPAALSLREPSRDASGGDRMGS